MRGYYVKVINRRCVSFGRWDDPDRGKAEGSLSEVDPTGRMWRVALAKCEAYAATIHAAA